MESNGEFVEAAADAIENTEEVASEPASVTWNWSQKPLLVVQENKEFKEGNFLKGCKWSPDGLCLLTCSNDNQLRIFNLPSQLHPSSELTIKDEISIECALKIREPEGIYDYCWYPGMNSCFPETCCLVSTTKDQPIHLWDAYNGTLRASYCGFNHLDEVTAAYSLECTPDGSQLYAGYHGHVRIFDISRPGRDCSYRKTRGVQNGIISCIAFPLQPQQNLYAVGSYDRSIALYSESDGSNVCSLMGHSGGVTHLQFSPDGIHLYSGGRKDNELLCWDLRKPGEVLFKAKRSVETNQRIYFDLDRQGKWLVSGQQDGRVLVWAIGNEEELTVQEFAETCNEFDAHLDAVNGVSLHPYLALLATTSGQRVFQEFEDSDSEEESQHSSQQHLNSLKIWLCQGRF